MKLQRRVVALVEERKLDINQLAFMARIYSESTSSLSPIFDLLAQELEFQMEEMREEGFVDCFIALLSTRLASKNPKMYKSALYELDEILVNNSDRYSLECAADLLNFLSQVTE